MENGQPPKMIYQHHKDVYFDPRIRVWCCKFLHQLHHFSEQIYQRSQLANGYRCYRNYVLDEMPLFATFEDMITRFDTEFTAVLSFAEQRKFSSTEQRTECITKMKSYLRIFCNYIATEMAYLGYLSLQVGGILASSIWLQSYFKKKPYIKLVCLDFDSL